MSRRFPLLAVFLLLSFFVSCNNPVVQEEQPPAADPVLRGTLRVVDSSRTPDSITWNWNGRKGKALLACSEGICKFQASLSPVGPNDTVSCGFWTLGLRTMQGTARLDGSGDLSVDHKSIRIDTVVKILLTFHDSLRKLDESRYPWTYSGLQDAFAMAILNRNAKVAGGYPKSWPAGIDTTGLVRRVVRLAIDGQGSLDQIASTWSLSLSVTQAKPIVLEILKERATGKDDSLRLFPPSSLKFAKLVSLGGVLWPDGDTVKLSGRVESDSVLARASVQILRGETVVTERFVIDTAPSVSGKSWDLDGNLRIRAKVGTEMGSYTMAIQVWDKLQSRILHTVPFKVEPRPDHEGPTIQFLKPMQMDVIEPKDSLVRIYVKGNDASGIDSITVQGRRTKISGDTAWLDVSTPLKGNSFIFIVTAWDRMGNRSDSILQLRRREVRDSLVFELVSPSKATDNSLPMDSSFIHVQYHARSPYGIPDTGLSIGGLIARRGGAPNDTDNWFQEVPVPADGKVSRIIVTLTDRRGVQTFHVIQVTREKDEKGPTIRWISPSRDSVVDFNSSLVEIRVEAKDPSGIDSVSIQGRKAEKLSEGRYFGLVSLEPTGFPTDIHVRSWDGQGKETDSVIQVTRSSSPAVIQLIQPIKHTGNVVADWVDTFRVVWKLPKDLVKCKVESSSKDSLVNLGGGLWATTVRLERGLLRKISIQLIDSLAGTQAKDEVEVTRPEAVVAPAIRFATPLDSLGGDTLVTRDATLNLAWKLAAPCLGCIFEVDGLEAKPAQEKDSLVVGSKVSQIPGLQNHTFVISKGTTTLLRKEYKIRRIQSPRIDTIAPVSSLQSGSLPVEVVWKVAGGTRVWIDGIDQGGTGDGLYRVTVSKPESSVRVVRIAVADSGRGKDSSSRRIQWTSPVSFHMDATPSDPVQWDSVQFSLTSVASTIGAVTFRWEADQGRKGTAKPNETVVLYSSGRMTACASLAGFLDTCDTSATFDVRHTNQAPSFERPSVMDTLVIDEDSRRGELFLARNLRKGSKWDTAQALHFEVKSLARPGLYVSIPKVDVQTGILSFVPVADSFGLDSLEIKLCDDGGTEHGGKDCGTAMRLKVLVRPVNDAPIGVPWSVSVPVSEGYVKVVMEPVSSGPGEAFVSSMTFKPTLKTGANAKTSSLSIVRGRGKDTVILVPGTYPGGADYEVVATEAPEKAGDAALTTSFPLSIRVENVWKVEDRSIPLVVALGKTWLTQSLLDSANLTELTAAKSPCPAGWALPDSLTFKNAKTTDSTFLKEIGLESGKRLWAKTPTGFRMATVDLTAKVDTVIGFSEPAADKKAIVRCVYVP